ncbi:DUF7562 family protein [Natrinema altunense]|uniref:Small CPxCG-related zinc finger protein n=1 Tax=Natrinema altunense (strain JCM 12890 / CGMCC 1.3731 / AJ2) TaxID=1227494 RepID=L9ZQG8_NATA2|nr:hypothetical protein [Natrinema altunense]ELY87398.1 hypothetical protein C485_06715 [Natrinema altunense JCM 12890]
MWPSKSRTETVTCLACGAERPRDEAREYDKHGDRWDRDGKTFEHLCKSCHGDLCHHPRDELEALLVDLEAGERDRAAFLTRYLATVEERYGTLEERER